MEENNNPSKIDIVVLGHILKEKIIFPDKEIYPVLGSPVAYSSVCMASLNASVGLVTKIGKDFPQKLLSVFDKIGVNREGIIIGKNSTSNELIYNKDGDKKLKFLTRASEILFKDIPSSYIDADIFYICPMNYEISIETIKNINNLGKIMAVDLGGYGGGTSEIYPEIKDGHEVEELCLYFDIVKASIEDCYHIFGTLDGDERKISEKIIDWGAKVCVITLGEKGSFVKTANKESYIPAFQVGKSVDPTGAGDCYFAGFLVKFLASNDPYISAIYGTATTSYIIEQSGGVVASRMPNMKEVKRRVEVIKELMS